MIFEARERNLISHEINVITDSRFTPYIISRDNLLGGRVFYNLHPSFSNTLRDSICTEG
jgi:hypothetical protein